MAWCWLRQAQDRALASTSSAVKDPALPRVERPSCSDGNNTGGASNQLPSFLQEPATSGCALHLQTASAPGIQLVTEPWKRMALVSHVPLAGHPGHGKPSAYLKSKEATQCSDLSQVLKIKLLASRCWTIMHGLSKEQTDNSPSCGFPQGSHLLFSWITNVGGP